MMDNPDKIVAEAIHKKFNEADLLRDSDLDKIIEKLTSGSISEEDWSLIAELSIGKNKGEESA